MIVEQNMTEKIIRFLNRSPAQRGKSEFPVYVYTIFSGYQIFILIFRTVSIMEEIVDVHRSEVLSTKFRRFDQQHRFIRLPLDIMS